MHTSTMRNIWLGFSTCALLLSASSSEAEEPPQLVEDTCDEIAIVYVSSRPDCGAEVVFIRNARVLHRRSLADSMFVTAAGDTFILMWTDWGCERAVSTKRFGIYEIEPLAAANSGPWWVAPVLQLKQP